MSMSGYPEYIRFVTAAFRPLLLGVLLLVAGCSPRVIQHQSRPVPAVELVSGQDCVYNMELGMKNSKMSCMLAVKKSGSCVRAAAVTWFGMSLFDVIVGEADMKVISSAAFLERKSLMRLLDRNLQCIFIDSGRIVREGGLCTVSRRSGLVCTVSELPDGSLGKVHIRHRLSGIELELTPVGR